MAGNAGLMGRSLGKGPASALGALTGLVALIAMIRLIAGAGLTSMFAWVFLLSAMLPWIGYCTWRARHGTLRPRAALGVLGLAGAGLIGAWLFTIGPVVALACSLLAFVIIWVHDWPALRERRESQYVGVEELTADRADGANDADGGADEPGWPGGFAAEGQPRELTTETPRTAA